jgi:sugar O-acyltransferase (sialic acid O-acetyltransferase NeuD family)
MKDIFVFGAGTHPKPVIEAIRATGKFRIEAFVDAVDISNPQTSGQRFGCPVATMADVASSNIRAGIVAINTNFFRAKTVDRILEKFPNFEFVTVVHPTAQICEDVEIMPGSVVLSGAFVGTGSRIGHHALLNTRALIEHDCTIGNFGSVLSGAIVCGEVELGECSAICAGATVIHRRKIGKHTIIGAGSVVTQDIPDLVVAVGNPCVRIKPRTIDQKYL